MKTHSSFAAAACLAICLSAPALAQSQSSASSQGASSSGLKIQQDEPSQALQALKDAVRELRQASVSMVDQHEQNPAAEKAFQSAQAAIRKIDNAMIELPSPFKPGDIRNAKDWPKAAAHFDKATADLEHAINDLGDKQSGQERDQAIQTLHKAMGDVHQGMVSLPAWQVGSK
jgi:hypothetical protein